MIFKEAKTQVINNTEKVITNQEFTESDSMNFMIKPILITNPVPPYPRLAVEKRIEGNVRIKFLIDKRGNVVKSEVLATSGFPILDSAARNYVFGLKYSPAKEDGKPKNSWMSMLFKYTLSAKDDY